MLFLLFPFLKKPLLHSLTQIGWFWLLHELLAGRREILSLPIKESKSDCSLCSPVTLSIMRLRSKSWRPPSWTHLPRLTTFLHPADSQPQGGLSPWNLCNSYAGTSIVCMWVQPERRQRKGAGILEQSVRAGDPAGNRLAGRYYNSIPVGSLALTDCFKILAT